MPDSKNLFLRRMHPIPCGIGCTFLFVRGEKLDKGLIDAETDVVGTINVVAVLGISATFGGCFFLFDMVQ